jgi:hypothetical protein
MRNSLYALLFASIIGCNNTSEKTPNNKPEVKPVVSPPTKPPEPSTKVVTSAPASVPAALAANLPPFNKEKQLLFDPRIKLEKSNTPKDVEKKLLDKLFTKRLKSMKECKYANDGPKTSEEDIAAGQIYPSILSSTTGIFTTAGATQTAYVVDVGECHAEMTRDTPETSALLVIMTGDEIIINQKDFSHWNHVKAVDLDQDGLHELVTINEYEGMDASKYLLVYKLAGKEFKNQENILSDQNVYLDSCYLAKVSEGAQEGNIILSVISYTPTEAGKMPTFSAEKLTASCKKGAAFTPFKE